MADKEHWGKIATHLPNRGNPNADVWNIEFRPKNGNANLEIDRVYMVPSGATIQSVADLQHYIVWTTDVTLVPENDTVCIEYIPNVDIQLSNVAVFSADSETSDTVNFAIYHESGLVVAKSNQASHTSTTKFGQSGNRWLTAVSGVTLKKGLKYYIQFTNNGATIKSVAMDGWYGNYKVFYNGQAQSKNVANINNAHDWLGTIDDSIGIFSMKPGDFFLWNASGWRPDMSNGTIYMRSNVGANIQFSGVIGTPSNPQSLNATDLANLLAKPYQSAFIWYVSNYPNMTSGDIYQKTTDFNVDNTNLIDFTEYTYNNHEYFDTARVFYEHYQDKEPICSDGLFWYDNTVVGQIFILATGYTSKVTSLTPLSSLPDNPQNGEIYFLAAGLITGDYSWTDCCYAYNNGTWSPIVQATWKTYITLKSISTWLTRVGNNADLIDSQYGGGAWDNNYQSNGLRSAATETDQKFYLEINGTEV